MAKSDVHVTRFHADIGLALWVKNDENTGQKDNQMPDKPIEPEKAVKKKTWRLDELRGIFQLTIVLQVGSMILAAGILDVGECATCCFLGTIGYWLMFAFLVGRRANLLTMIDVILIRYGYLIWLPIGACLVFGLEHLIGGPVSLFR